MQEYLTELEVQKIEQFNNDKEMVEAVKKVILQGLYTHGTIVKGAAAKPLQNGALRLASLAMENPIPDEQIGAHVRAMFAGLNAMENAFKDIALIKTPKKGKDKVDNPAI